MRLFKRILLCLLAVLLPLSAAGKNLHQELPCAALQVDAAIGYDGLMTYGKLMPLRIRVENLGADMSATLAVNVYASRSDYNRYEMELSLAASAVKEVCIPVYAGSKQETFTVEVWDNGSKTCAVNVSPAQVLNPSAMLIGVLSDAPEKLSYLNIDNSSDELLRAEYMQTVPLSIDSFPETGELLSAFGMLVVDGFDVSLLSASQRQALDTWLEAGHILLVGGGAQASIAWPAFAAYTGLTAGAPVTCPDVTPALLQWVSSVGVPAGKALTITQGTGATPLVTQGDTPLIWKSTAGNSVVFTTAFSLSDSALTSWLPMHTLWQRALVQEQYSLYQSCLYPSGSLNSFNYAAARLPLENDVPLLPAVLCVAAIAVLGTLLAYIFLKRRDKRQWLWAILPGLAAVSVAVVCALGASSAAARPAVLSLTLFQQEADSIPTLRTSLVVGAPKQGEQIIRSDVGTIHPLDERSGYYDYDAPAPVTLNYRYLLGDSTGLGVNMASPWATRRLLVDDLPTPQGQINAALWMEDDGFHGTIVNETQLHMNEGVLVCKYGFCSVPALAPGESCTISLVKTAADPKDPYLFKDGCMYESMAGGSIQTYAIMTQYYRTRLNLDQKEELPQDANLMLDLTNQVLDKIYWGRNSLTSSYYNSSSATRFHYLTTCDQLPAPRISMNGQEVTRTSTLGIVAAEADFISQRDNQVCYLPWECPALPCQTDSSGAPAYDESTAPAVQSYYRLNKNPTFMFQVAQPLATLERLCFYTDYMPRNAQAYLYNGSSWVAYTMGEELAAPQQYMDKQGRIFLQYRPTSTVDDYQELMAPAMLLEGSVK